MTLALATAQKPMIWNVDPFLVDPRFRALWDGKVGHWPMWEGGGAPRDISGNGKHTALPGGGDDPVWTVGASGLALLFDTTDHLDIAKAVVATFPITIGVHCKLNVVNAIQNLLMIADSSVINNYFSLVAVSGRGWEYQVRSGDVFDSPGFSVANGGTVDTDEHIIVTVSESAANHKIYLDGVLLDTDTNSTTPAGLDRTQIGESSDSTPGPSLDGLVYSAFAANRALSAAEIALLSAYPYGDITLMEDAAMLAEIAAVGGRIMSSLTAAGGLAGPGGIAGRGGGLAGG